MRKSAHLRFEGKENGKPAGVEKDRRDGGVKDAPAGGFVAVTIALAALGIAGIVLAVRAFMRTRE